MQDIVVEGWQDAEAAVDFLKRNQAGRATFLPLDSLRPGRASDVPRAAGVLGLASELVKFDPAIRPAVELALNRTVVVEDLPTARRLLGRAGGATLVTLDGEIVRSSGSVTGGAENRAKDSGMLSRARTLRELPPQIEAGTAQVAAHEAACAGARREQAAARAALDALAGEAGEDRFRAEPRHRGTRPCRDWPAIAPGRRRRFTKSSGAASPRIWPASKRASASSRSLSKI